MQFKLIFIANLSFSVFFWANYFHEYQLFFALFAQIHSLWFSVQKFRFAYLWIVSRLCYWVLFIRWVIIIWSAFFVSRVKCPIIISLFVTFRTPFIVRALRHILIWIFTYFFVSIKVFRERTRIFPRIFTSIPLPDLRFDELRPLLHEPATIHHVSELEAKIATNDSLLRKINIYSITFNCSSITTLINEKLLFQSSHHLIKIPKAYQRW